MVAFLGFTLYYLVGLMMFLLLLTLTMNDLGFHTLHKPENVFPTLNWSVLLANTWTKF